MHTFKKSQLFCFCYSIVIVAAINHVVRMASTLLGNNGLVGYMVMQIKEWKFFTYKNDWFYDDISLLQLFIL